MKTQADPRGGAGEKELVNRGPVLCARLPLSAPAWDGLQEGIRALPFPFPFPFPLLPLPPSSSSRPHSPPPLLFFPSSSSRPHSPSLLLFFPLLFFPSLLLPLPSSLPICHPLALPSSSFFSLSSLFPLPSSLIEKVPKSIEKLFKNYKKLSNKRSQSRGGSALQYVPFSSPLTNLPRPPGHPHGSAMVSVWGPGSAMPGQTARHA